MLLPIFHQWQMQAADKTITLPVNKITLAGSGTDADGTVVSYLWTKISGPTSYSIVNAASPVTDSYWIGTGNLSI